MLPLLSAAEGKALDATAEARFGLSVELLMEHAGRSVAEAAAPLCQSGRAVVFVGPGHNGGDGLVAARQLRARGLRVEVALTAAAGQLKGLAAINWERWRRVAGGGAAPAGGWPSLGAGDLAIDALLGTGTTRPAEGRVREAIQHLNAGRAAGARVVAIDLPSGLDSDRGLALGEVVQAERTVTLGARKRGLAQEPGASLAGEICVGSIGLPPEVFSDSAAHLLERSDVLGWLPPRLPASFKNDAGHLLIVAGSPGKTGAAALATRAALRSGAGLVTLAGREAVVAQALVGHPEAMSIALPGRGALGDADAAALRSALEGKRALAIGPGLWHGSHTARLLAKLLKSFDGATVLDADALNALDGHRAALLQSRGPTVVTPHPGEMARLIGSTPAQVQADRFGVASAFARAARTVVVLKGAKTIVASPKGQLAVVPTGSPALAHGGTGDVLCGLIGGLLAQGLPAFEAACAGAYLHGLAGDRVALRQGERGLVAGDLPDALGQIWAELGR